MKKKYLGIILLVVLGFMLGSVSAQDIEIRPLEVGDAFSYQNTKTGEIVAFEILDTNSLSDGGPSAAQNSFFTYLANGNDSTLIGGFPRYQELLFPEEIGFALEVYGDLYDVNYTFGDGLFLLSASQNRSISFDTFSFPAITIENVTFSLYHEADTHPFTPNIEYEDYMQYSIYVNTSYGFNQFFFNMTVNFLNDITVSQQYIHPVYGNQRVNATQTFTFLSGTLHVEYYDPEVVGEEGYLYYIDTTEYLASKGTIEAIVERTTGIPDEIYYDNDRGFDVSTTSPEPAAAVLGYGPRAAQVDRSVTYVLIESNIEPIEIPDEPEPVLSVWEEFLLLLLVLFGIIGYLYFLNH